MDTIRIGSRASNLAMWQAKKIEEILKPVVKVEILKYSSKGDEILNQSLHKINDKGLFTKELENALLNKEIDIAVHSLKDLPGDLPEGLILSSFPVMEDPRDALISKFSSINDIPIGGVIATGSLRRKSQLLHIRPDLRIVDIRGNIETRIQKYHENEYDGLILAYAGLIRLNLTHLVSYIIDEEIMIPAVGQGILGIESRRGYKNHNFLRKINLPNVEKKALIAREFLKHIEGGCSIPAGCIIDLKSDDSFLVRGFIGTIDGKRLIKDHISGNFKEVKNPGSVLAQRILGKGGKEIRKDLDL